MSLTTSLPASAVRLTTPGLAPHLSESIGEGGGYEASDAYYVPWADVDGDGTRDYLKFMDVAAGSTEPVGSGVFGTRYIPLRFPVANQTILATGAESEWVGWDATATGPAGETGWYRGAIVRIRYRTPKHDVSGTDAMLTIRGTPAVYPMLIPPGGLTIGSGTNAVPIARPVGGYTYHVEAKNVAGFDPAAWGPGSGRINIYNNAAWRSFPTGTVKLPGLSFTRTVRFGGTATHDVGLPFEVREVPWNQEYDGSGTLGDHAMLTAADFTTLFGF